VRCAFIRNSAPAGGAVWLDKSHPARFDSCTFTDNTATATDGGAIAQEFGGDLQGIVISGGTFTGNTAARHGGAIRCTGWSGALEVTNAHFTDNEAGFQGGAISIDRQSLAIADCTFTSNRAHEPTYEGGGAIFAFFSPEASPANTVFRSVFSGNSTPGRGGAIAFYYGVATGISDCTFAGNSAGHLGGAVVTHASCSTRMTTSRLSGNSAPTGAAIACIGANDPSVPVVRVEGCDFASNAGPSAIDSSATPAVELSGNVYCQSGTMPATGSVVEVGPSCTTATCTDFNNNGRPDGCECSSNPNLPSCCLGDIFSDGLVNGGDLGILLSQWGQSGVASDLDANGIVDGADLGLLLSGWGPCPN
jgi:predicted outer membrane repeat protein